MKIKDYVRIRWIIEKRNASIGGKRKAGKRRVEKRPDSMAGNLSPEPRRETPRAAEKKESKEKWERCGCARNAGPSCSTKKRGSINARFAGQKCGRMEKEPTSGISAGQN